MVIVLSQLSILFATVAVTHSVVEFLRFILLDIFPVHYNVSASLSSEAGKERMM